jgi:hypothetical protein
MLDLYPVVLEDSRIINLDRQTNDPWRLNFPGVTPEMEFMRLDESLDAMTNPLKPWEDFFFGPEGAGAGKGAAAIRGFYNYYPVKHPKDGTQVIATFSDPLAKMADGREQPYLAFMPYGTGKVFWIGSGEMWRLRGYKESYHDRFWAKLTRFVGSGSLTQLNKRISPIHGRSFPANTFVTIDAKVLGKDMKPLDERSKPKLVLTPPRGALEKDLNYDMTKKLSTAEGWTGTFTSRFLARTPGEYQYRIEVPETGDTESGKFLIKESNPELDNTRPDYDLMYDLASEADGVLSRVNDQTRKDLLARLLKPVKTEKAEGDAPAEPKENVNRDKPHLLFELKNADIIPSCMTAQLQEEKNRGQVRDHWDKWWFLGLAVGLLAIEWLTRKLLRLA